MNSKVLLNEVVWISEYIPDMKHFRKADLCSFLGLNMFVFSYLKLHLPHQNFLDWLLRMNTRLERMKR